MKRIISILISLLFLFASCVVSKKENQMDISGEKWGKIVADESLKDSLLVIARSKGLISEIAKDSITYNLIETNNFLLIEILPKFEQGGNKQLKVKKNDYDSMEIGELHL